MPRTNLSPNPSLESVVTGYAVTFVRAGITSTAVARSSSVAAQSGTFYGFVNITGAPAGAGLHDVNLTGPTFPVTASLPYTVAPYMRHQVLIQGGVVIEWLDAAGVVVSITESGYTAVTDTWGRKFTTGTAPTGATQARMVIRLTGITDVASRSFRFDAVLYEQTTVLGTYFDGTTTGYQWDGTAHVSTSSEIVPASPLGTAIGGGGIPTRRSIGWELLVAETIGGTVIAELLFTSLPWNKPINGIGTLSATIPVEQHVQGLGPWDDRDPRWILRSIFSGEWKFSLCAVFDRRPIIAGPIITSQPVTGEASVTLGAAELPALLKRRKLRAPGFADPTDPAADVHLGPVSLPRLMRELIEVGTDPANGAGWLLPLQVDNVAYEGGHVRHYPAADLASVWERIEDLTGVEDGPDIRFEPALTELGDGQLLYWQVRIGEPHLGAWVDGENPPMPPWIWDSGANLRDLNTDRDASDMTMRAFVPGQAAPAAAGGESSVDTSAPQDAPKPIGRAEDLSLLTAGYPILESAYTGHTSVSRRDTLDAHAAGYVTADSRPVETWSVTVDADTDPRLGDWRVGDAGRFDVRGQLMVDDGTYDRRIVGASGTAGTDVQLVLTPVPAVV